MYTYWYIVWHRCITVISCAYMCMIYRPESFMMKKYSFIHL